MRLDSLDRPIADAGHLDVQAAPESSTASRVAHLAGLGLDDDDIARVLDIERATARLWRTVQGERPVRQSVEMRLFQFATGGDRIVRRRGVDVVEHVLPDARAAIFWLENRQPGAWGPSRPERSGLA